TAVWMGGIDQEVGMFRVGGRAVGGSSYPAQIFGRFMNMYLENRPDVPVPEPPQRRSTGLLKVDSSIDITPPPRPVAPPTTEATDEETPPDGATTTVPGPPSGPQPEDPPAEDAVPPGTPGT